jgi:hypothetical protein
MLPSPTALPAAAKINPSRELNCPRFDAIVFSPNRHRSLAEVGLRKSAIKRFRLAKTAGAYAMIRAFIARVVKLVDTRDLKSLAGNSVPVQVRPRAPSRSTSVLIDLPSAFCLSKSSRTNPASQPGHSAKLSGVRQLAAVLLEVPVHPAPGKMQFVGSHRKCAVGGSDYSDESKRHTVMRLYAQSDVG